MKKLLVLFAILFAIVAYAEDEPAKEIWEVAPGIISGGYSQETGPYIFKFLQTTRPVLGRPAGSKDRYGAVLSATISVGYGDFMVHAEPDPDDDGYVPPASVSDHSVSFSMSISSLQFVPSDYTYSVPGTYYVYKKEFIEPLLGDFNHENYNIKVGQFFRVGFPPTGGSGYYSVSIGSKPAFLVRDDVATWSGTCYTECLTSISIIVTDIVTGEKREAFATIIVSEDPEDPTFPDDTTDDDDTDDTDTSDDSSDPSDPSSPSDPSDPSEPSEPTDPSNPDSPDSPTEPSDPDDPDTPDNPDSPDEPETPDTPSEPTDPSNPDTPDEPDDPSEPDSPDTPDSPDEPTELDEPVVVVPDSPDTPDDPVVVPDNPDEPEDSEDSEPSDTSDESDETVIISDTTEEDEPTVIVINDSSSSDSDKIVVTDDGVITVKPDNYDLAVFMSMFGAMTGLNGSIVAPADTSMAGQEAREGKSHE